MVGTVGPLVSTLGETSTHISPRRIGEATMFGPIPMQQALGVTTLRGAGLRGDTLGCTDCGELLLCHRWHLTTSRYTPR